ncbi:hypothetical protein TWF730_010936 [Orbilia blumenaviensis]|uniref:MYND-type domain-containing protein n=1 Tax=Orbilia blumenaviensis TaxID=1796055 RepID=A0AAV9UMG4_9PEZI
MTEIVIHSTDSPSEAYTILKEYELGEEKECAICQAKSTITCSTCNGIAYCGSAHEIQDRPYHHLICAAAASIPPRPKGENWVAVLVLPEYSKEPYYVWSPYKLNRHNLPVFEQSAWYGVGYKSRPTFIYRHPLTLEILSHAITRFEFINTPAEGQPRKPPGHTNLCIHRLTGGINSTAFKGTLLIVTLARLPDKSKNWLLSFKPQDIRILVEALKRPETQKSPTLQSISIKAVACYPSRSPDPKSSLDDNNSTGSTNPENIVFENLNIPINHAIFTYDTKNPHIYIPPISKVYNFPIRMFRYLNYHGPVGNTFISSLFPMVEIKRTTSGPRPITAESKMEPQKLGAVIFARTDGKPLEASHLQGLADFIEYATGIWAAYDKFAKKQEDAMEKHIKDGNAGKPKYLRIEPDELDMVVKMDKTLEVKAFKEFWMAKNDGDQGPFLGVNMDPDEDDDSSNSGHGDANSPVEIPAPVGASRRQSLTQLFAGLEDAMPKQEEHFVFN